MSVACIGIDLAWSERNPSGVAAAELNPNTGSIHVFETDWLHQEDRIPEWITKHSQATTVVAIDAPIYAPNLTRGRQCDRDLSSDFGPFQAGCHPAFYGKCRYPIAFRGDLARLGFNADPSAAPQNRGLWQIEVYPHPWHVVLFGLHKTIKYKKGRVDSKWSELQRLVQCMQTCLSKGKPHLLESLALNELYDLKARLRGREFKQREDRLDAVICAFAAAYYWLWGEDRCRVYYSNPKDFTKGYIVTPRQKESRNSRDDE